MRPKPRNDKKYMRWAVDHYRCAVNSAECCKRRTFALLTHSPVPAKGAGVVLCMIHKQANTGASLVSVGRESFEQLHDLDLGVIATMMQIDYDGEMEFGEAPKGAIRV